MMLRALSMAGVLAALGCRASPPPAATSTTVPASPVGAASPADAAPPVDAAALDRDLPRLVERSLAMYEDIARVFADGADDCAAVVARLGELAETYRDVAAANAKVVRDGRVELLRQALEPHGPAFDAAARAIVQAPVMARCSSDPAFGAAFDRLVAAPP